MKRNHKLDGTGLGLDTALSAVDLRSICVTAAPQATGTLWKGQERITLVRDSENLLVFEMPALIKAIKRMVFSVAITEKSGRRQLLTTINDYMTTRWMLWSMIPIGPREMTGHYVYVEFLELVARTVRAADATAVARLELGPHQKASIPNITPLATAALPEALIPVVVAPVMPAIAAVADSDSESALDRTMLVERRPRAVRWRLEGDDGVSVDIDVSVVLGRDPHAVDGHVNVAAVALQDPSVSASHALAEVRDARLVVLDLGSTNGTVVLDASGNERACPPGEAVEVAEGAAIELGAYTLVARSELRRNR